MNEAAAHPGLAPERPAEPAPPVGERSFDDERGGAHPPAVPAPPTPDDLRAMEAEQPALVQEVLRLRLGWQDDILHATCEYLREARPGKARAIMAMAMESLAVVHGVKLTPMHVYALVAKKAADVGFEIPMALRAVKPPDSAAQSSPLDPAPPRADTSR